MNRFKAIEEIFEKYGWSINGQEIWKYILKRNAETGLEEIEDVMSCDGARYRIVYTIDRKDIFYDENDKEINIDDKNLDGEFDYVSSDIKLTNIQVSRINAQNDEHCFSWAGDDLNA